jgi:hypothetical protein
MIGYHGDRARDEAYMEYFTQTAARRWLCRAQALTLANCFKSNWDKIGRASSET